MKKYFLGICLVYSLIVMAAASQSSAETLTITMTGTGRGLVSADTGTILWSGLTGTAGYDLSTAVTLTALPNAGVSFMGWSGSCTGTGPCMLTMDTAKSVTALFSAVPRTGQTMSYAAGDDGDIQAGVAWPDPRFTVSSSGTGTVVTDSLTGLIWPQDGGTPTVGSCTGGTLTWQGALDYVACLNANNYLGHDDWRLPNVNELYNLVNWGQPNSATWLNTQGFVNAQAYYYWSSTTYANSYTNYAWFVYMHDGSANQDYKGGGYKYVWPVRSGQPGLFGSSIYSLPHTGQTSCYNTWGAVIACADTGQDGDLRTGIDWPNPRFMVMSSGTGTVVTDNLTGLMWPQNGGTLTVGSCTGGHMTWTDALTYVACLNTNNHLGHNDWRLPNINELYSLANWSQSSPADWLNTQGFENAQAYYYWSSTACAYGIVGSGAWGINIYYGYVDGYDKADGFYVWPVRGGHTLIFSNTAILAPALTYGTNGSVAVTVSSATSVPTGTVSLSVDGGAATSQVLSAVTSTSATATFTITKPTAGSHTLNVIYAAQGGFAASSASETLTVNQRTLTVLATGVSKTYDGTPNASVNFSDDRVSGDVFTDGYTSATFADTNVGTGKTITITGMNASGSDAGNYVVSPNSTIATADITARPLTITADPKSKATGSTDPELTYQITSGSLANGDTITGSLTRDPGETAGTYAIQQGTLTAGSNYQITFVGADLTIADAGPPAQIPQTGQTTVYAAGDNGNIQSGIAWPDPRFTVSSSGTGTVVADNLTGLIWTQDGGTPTVGSCTGGALTWQGALDYVACLNTNNYLDHNDWRLPNVNELQSLVNRGLYRQADWLNSQGFTNVQSVAFWSSTTYAPSPTFAWYVAMVDGFVYAYYKADNGYNGYVWPVRGGQSGLFGNSTIRLPLTGQTSCYDASGNIITCTGTGQDGALQAGVAWPSPRFTVSNSGMGTVVADNLTGLVWPQDGGTPTVGSCTGGSLTWQGALDYVACLNTNNYLGHNDWRLPNTNELSSLINYGQSNTSDWLNTQGFTNVHLYSYWSSTTSAAITSYAWIVYMNDGYTVVVDKTYSYSVWPVRGGQPGSFSNSVLLTVSKSGTGSGNVSADTGTILWSGATGTATFSLNTSVTLTAIAGSSCTFTGWSGACTGTGACTVTMNAAKSVTAMFDYTGTVTVHPVVIGHGTMDPGTDQQLVIGSRLNRVTFTIKPDVGYYVASVTGCNGQGGGIFKPGAQTKFKIYNVTENCTVTAIFAPYPYPVIPAAKLHGSISPNTVQFVNYDSTTAFTITPDTGYHITSVTGTGCGGTWDGVITGGTYTTGAIKTKCIVRASFYINTYTVTPTVVGGNGTIYPNTPVIRKYNTTRNFRITPSAGFQIDSVTGCNGTLNGNYYTTGPFVSDCTITATFK